MKVLEPLMTQSSPSRHRGGLQRGEVGAAGRLGHADRGQHLAGREARQPALLLLLGGEVDEVRRDDVGVDAEAGRQRQLTFASSSASTALNR